jgi:hypothetical protein
LSAAGRKVYLVIRRLDWFDGGDTILSIWGSKRKAQTALNHLESTRDYGALELLIEEWDVG